NSTTVKRRDVLAARRKCDYLPSLATACARRETLRFAALRWITPFCAARMISGAAAFTAATAASLLPVLIASSALRTAVRMRERRAVLTLVRRAMTRVALRAELVLAMSVVRSEIGALEQPPRSS